MEMTENKFRCYQPQYNNNNKRVFGSPQCANLSLVITVESFQLATVYTLRVENHSRITARNVVLKVAFTGPFFSSSGGSWIIDDGIGTLELGDLPPCYNSGASIELAFNNELQSQVSGVVVSSTPDCFPVSNFDSATFTLEETS